MKLQTLSQLCINTVDNSLLVLAQRSHVLWRVLVNANRDTGRKGTVMQWWIFQAESDASLLRLVCLVEFVFKYSTKIRNGQSANPCQLASRSVFMPTPRVSATSSRPSIHIIFQQTGQFVGPNPLQYKGHNGAYSGWLSSLDLLLPLGLPSFPSFPDRRECLDRQILVAKHVKTGVCAVRPHTSVQTWTHTPSGPVKVYQGALFPALRVLGEDFSCHTACSLGYSDGTNTEGAGIETLTLWDHI